MLIRRAELPGRGPCDVRIEGAHIASIEPSQVSKPGLGGEGDGGIDASGGALLPGLHDHHLHLFALATVESSVLCGPPQVQDAAQLAKGLATAARESGGPRGWLRGIGYHESVAGVLDRKTLDTWVADRPLRVQHRGGALWVLNSVGLARVGIGSGNAPAGVERDANGEPNGRLWRMDAWLRDRLGARTPPDLSKVGRRLASFGVTGLTDATVDNDTRELDALVAAVVCGALPQRLRVMGRHTLPAPSHSRVERGAVKLVLDDARLPDVDELTREIVRAHAAERSVAIHCVTRAELVLAVVALAAAGTGSGDRIEHAAVTPPELVEQLARLPITVVTQPHFIRERGDAYRRDVEARDLAWLYRCRGFLDAGIPLGGGTDAPFGKPDPWIAVAAAVDRRTESGVAMGTAEGLTPERALALFTTPPGQPGGAPRSLEVGARADLCLLDVPWRVAREDLSSQHVEATWCDGAMVWHRSEAAP
ncbi:amidohydrolase family protein [Myxococcota bacterium]|nr:amidohydrolase family protein [Myxococcota bacterium]